MSGLAAQLSALVTRTNPIYRPIVSEYAAIAARLSAGKQKGISQRLERLSSSRKALARQMRGIDDYMNWFEATKARGPIVHPARIVALAQHRRTKMRSSRR